MAIEVGSISPWDTLRLQAMVVTPAYFWGLVVPNPLLVPLLAKHDAPRWSVELLDGLRHKYRRDHLWTWFPLARTLLVLDPESIDAVLRSDANAADPVLKKRALSQFVPDALVISSGEAWRERRAFNEAVLDFGRQHHHGEAFREIVLAEVRALADESPAALTWPDFLRLGERIALQVLLGSGRIDPQLTRALARMAGRSNWLVLPRQRRAFAGFYRDIEGYLARHRGVAAPAACLMHDSAALPANPVPVPSQIGFWLFVLRDAIELHVARTLALIAAHPEVQQRAREEARGAAGPGFLEACLHEQLRLWTPVPILLRRAVAPFVLRDAVEVQPGEQILVHAGHYHRDRRVFGEDADRFAPDAAGRPEPLFFSRHRQSCAGQFLARFLITATLAALLARYRFELVDSPIPTGRVPCQYDHFGIALQLHAAA